LFARCRFETRLEVQVLYFCRSSERWQDPVLQYLLQILDVQVLAAARTRIFRLPAALRCTGLEDGAGGGQRFVRSGLPSANDSVLLAPTSCRCLKSWSWILMPCRALGCLVSLPIILPTSSSHSRRYLVTAPFFNFYEPPVSSCMCTGYTWEERKLSFYNINCKKRPLGLHMAIVAYA
jgi:hypothetical protein